MLKLNKTAAALTTCAALVGGTTTATFVLTPSATAEVEPGHEGHDHGDKDKASQSEKKDIVGVATGEGMSNVTTLVKAIKAAGLVEALQGDGPFTVFAPTNEAFEKLPQGTLDNLLKPENKEQLKEILLYHVVEGKKTSKDLETMSAETLQGSSVDVSVEGDEVMVNTAKVTKADVMASNGVIHQIDTVLLPTAAE